MNLYYDRFISWKNWYSLLRWSIRLTSVWIRMHFSELHDFLLSLVWFAALVISWVCFDDLFPQVDMELVYSALIISSSSIRILFLIYISNLAPPETKKWYALLGIVRLSWVHTLGSDLLDLFLIWRLRMVAWHVTDQKKSVMITLVTESLDKNA